MAPITLLSISLYALAASARPSQDKKRPTAVIDSGCLVGTTTKLPSSEATVNQFLGIPFGAPPVRFSAPKPAEPWSPETYDATEYKPACVQKFNYPEAARNRSVKIVNTPGPPAGEDEDCLNLNVYAPASKENGHKAVLFWLFGGAYHYGTGSLPMYDGSKFAADQDIVVVTSNYRTNIFGFPGSPGLPEGERNLAFLDQRLALDWVQRNIKAFGGDPDKVTIVGQSAGAGSVNALILAPPDPVPFRGAILQSGGASETLVNTTGAWLNATRLANCTGSDALECMRALPVNKLKTTVEKAALDFGPIPDGGVTYSDHSRRDRLASKSDTSLVARVPMLWGSTSGEGRFEALLGLDLKTALPLMIPGTTANPVLLKVLNMIYPIGSPDISDDFDQVTKILTDFGSLCPTKFITDDSISVEIPTWRYLYNASFPNSEIFEGSGSYHGSDLDMVFGTYDKKNATPFQKVLSRDMQEAWARFVKYPKGGPGWDPAPKIGVLGGSAGDETLEVVESARVDFRCHPWKKDFDKRYPRESDWVGYKGL